MGREDQRFAGALGDELAKVVGLGCGEFAHGEVVDQDGRAGELAEPLVPGPVGASAGQVGPCPAGLHEPGVGARADGEVGEALEDGTTLGKQAVAGIVVFQFVDGGVWIDT